MDDTLKLRNKANLWVSDASWKLEEKEGLICIKNTLENKVLGATEDVLEVQVTLELFSDGSNGQLWMKGEENNEGYFTLKHSDSAKYLTAVSENKLELKGN